LKKYDTAISIGNYFYPIKPSGGLPPISRGCPFKWNLLVGVWGLKKPNHFSLAKTGTI
jgi:hypothetical protein